MKQTDFLPSKKWWQSKTIGLWLIVGALAPVISQNPELFPSWTIQIASAVGILNRILFTKTTIQN